MRTEGEGPEPLERLEQRYPANAQAVHGWIPVELEKCEGTLRGVVCPRRRTEGVKPDALKGASPVLNGGCDMKSSQSLLCATRRRDTTRCPISGILRRCAGRQRLVQSLRTMNPQSSDWHHTREGMMYLSAPRRRWG